MLHKEFETITKNAILTNLDKLMVIDIKDVDPTVREVITKIVENLAENNQILLDGIIDILKEVDYKLLNKNGDFKKVGILNWKNTADYLSFAGFVKDKIKEMRESINEVNEPKEDDIARNL